MNNRFFILAAVARNRVIGLANRMPWVIPEDLKYFKSLTWDNIVVMGRKTYESIGKPLPGRVNVVFASERISGDVITVGNLEEFFSLVEQKNGSGEWKEKDIFIIGGEKLFESFLPYVAKLYLTRIYENFPGDTFFPEIDMQQWNLVSNIRGIRNAKNPYDYEFHILERKI